MIMIAKELKEQKFSIYNSVWHKKGYEINFNQYVKLCENDKLKDIIFYIRSIEDETKQKEEKTLNVPVAMIHCLAGNDKNGDNIQNENNLFVLDLDGQDNEILLTKEGRDKMKEMIFKENYVLFVAESCRGKGLYAVIGIEDNSKVKNYFRKISEEFKDKFNLVIDRQCSNANRLRYLSYDENARIKDDNEDIELWNKEAECKVIEYNIEETDEDKKDILFSNIDYVSMLIKMIFDNGYRTNDYYDWLVCGFNLKFLGYEDGFKVFNYISSISEGYNKRKVEEKWDECYKTGKNTYKQMYSFWGAKAKQYIGECWKQKVRNEYIKYKYKN